MRTWIICILNLMTIVSSSLIFAANFEGVIHMKSTFGGGTEARTSESDWFIKGDNIRTERRAKSVDTSPTDQMGGMIFNADTKKGYMIMPERKMYMELPETSFEKTAEHLKDMKYEIVRTGKTDTVAGYQCEIFQTKSKETGKIRGESCASKGLGNMGAFMGLNRTGAGKLSGDFSREVRDLIKERYFLLRIVTKDEDGSEKMRMEAMSVERKTLDNSLFVPPPDYTKFEINAVMQNRRKSSREGGTGDQSQGNVDSPTP